MIINHYRDKEHSRPRIQRKKKEMSFSIVLSLSCLSLGSLHKNHKQQGNRLYWRKLNSRWLEDERQLAGEEREKRDRLKGDLEDRNQGQLG
jgi:hypothetical protein